MVCGRMPEIALFHLLSTFYALLSNSHGELCWRSASGDGAATGIIGDLR